MKGFNTAALKYFPELRCLATVQFYNELPNRYRSNNIFNIHMMVPGFDFVFFPREQACNFHLKQAGKVVQAGMRPARKVVCIAHGNVHAAGVLH